LHQPSNGRSPDSQKRPLLAPERSLVTHGAALNRRKRSVRRRIEAKVFAPGASKGFVVFRTCSAGHA
jgi:hypothetical protein